MQLRGDLYWLPAEIHQSNRISLLLKERHDLSSCRNLPDMPLCCPEPGRLLDQAVNSLFSCTALARGCTCSAALAQSLQSPSAPCQPVLCTASPTAKVMSNHFQHTRKHGKIKSKISSKIKPKEKDRKDKNSAVHPFVLNVNTQGKTAMGTTVLVDLAV